MHIRTDMFEQRVLKTISDIKNEHKKYNGILKIPIYNDKEIIAYLRAVTKSSLEDKTEVKNLAEWRDKHQHWFPAQFTVTVEGTKRWLENQLLKQEDRLLFMVETIEGQPFGHMGFYRFDYQNFAGDVDNVVRGRDVLHGVMTPALYTLTHWAFSYLKVKKLFLNVFQDNTRAISLYKRCGFTLHSKIPLKREEENGTIQWVELPQNTREKSDNHYLRMIFNK